MKFLVRLAALLAAFWTVPAYANDTGANGNASAAAAASRIQLEDAVLARINFARQNPKAFAEQLRTYRTWFRGNILYLPGDREGVYLEEGVAAVDEAIAFLERQAPMPPLGRADLLKLAARDHVSEQGARGIIGHGSLDGASPGTRVQRRGGGIYVGENISYGFADADEVVRQFIVDDGVADRGHRHALFSDDYRFAGVGCGTHSVYRHMCVVDMSATHDGSPDTRGWPQGAQLARVDTSRATQAGFQQASFVQPAATMEIDGEEYEVVEIVEVIEE